MGRIPKIIHYCWFGKNPLPPSALKCIESWRKYFPDYEVKEWNEDNFDVHEIPYISQAYEAKKYAFVSDYARFKILYENGGLYFDTDVEVIKSFSDILENGPFMGCEISSKKQIAVNPGLGLGAFPGMTLYRDILTSYSGLIFQNEDGSLNLKTIVAYTTELLQEKGLKISLDIQQLDGLIIYPKEYFNPFDDNTGRLKVTSKTHSIHWYSKSWMRINPYRQKISRFSHRIFGSSLISNIRKIFSKRVL